MTDEFKEKLDLFLESMTSGMDGFETEFAKIDIRRTLNSIWSKDVVVGDGVMERLALDGVAEPQFDNVELQSKETGYQVRPRVEFNGKIQAIDDIDAIVSYRTKG
jgi:hypothetical protein